MRAAAVLSITVTLLSGCAAATVPCVTTTTLSPATATAAVGGSVSYSLSNTTTGTSCVTSAVARLPDLTSSDTVNVGITGGNVAKCLGATTVPVVLTDSLSKTTATLTCQ